MDWDNVRRQKARVVEPPPMHLFENVLATACSERRIT